LPEARGSSFAGVSAANEKWKIICVLGVFALNHLYELELKGVSRFKRGPGNDFDHRGVGFITIAPVLFAKELF
jgi:hypothetical protein